ncbi:hypothetical protein V1478_013555 [Vespula squamosa]|uniref:Uncharacterized protein n=1 Tax=Vespula squamosa TaxID=30214 RepID=A0ABD2A5H3_VESSQ
MKHPNANVHIQCLSTSISYVLIVEQNYDYDSDHISLKLKQLFRSPLNRIKQKKARYQCYIKTTRYNVQLISSLASQQSILPSHLLSNGRQEVSLPH